MHKSKKFIKHDSNIKIEVFLMAGKKRHGKLRKDEYVETNIVTGQTRIRRRKKFKLL